MGTSTNAILYFGFDFCDQENGDDLPWGEDREWDEYYAEKMGVVNDSGLFTEDGELAFPEGSSEHAEADSKWDAWNKKKDKIAKKSGVTVDFHCHHEYPIWFVCTQQITANRGYPQKIKPEDLTHTEEEIQKLKDWCKVVGVKFKEPRWILASYWG